MTDYLRQHRKKIAIVGLLGAVLFVTGCAQSQPSVDQLRTIAHAIPLPAGLTFVDETDHLQRPGDFGTQNQQQVAITYKTPTPVDCGKLTADWRVALTQAHRKIDTDEGNQGSLYLKKGDVLIGLNTGTPGKECSGVRISLGIPN